MRPPWRCEPRCWRWPRRRCRTCCRPTSCSRPGSKASRQSRSLGRSAIRPALPAELDIGASAPASAPTPPTPSKPLPGTGPPSVPVPTGWDTAALAEVERELAQHVGPVARVLVRRAARGLNSLAAVRAGRCRLDRRFRSARALPGQGRCAAHPHRYRGPVGGHPFPGHAGRRRGAERRADARG